jgi:hypothetical protein
MKQETSIKESKINSASIAQEISKDLLHQKFIEAALNLDVSIVEPYIPEDMLLQDLGKYQFLEVLKVHFQNIEKKHPENWRVELANYFCLHCKHGKPLAGFEVFSGDNFLPYAKFGYFIEMNDKGETKDIYICNYMGTKNELNNSVDDYCPF